MTSVQISGSSTHKLPYPFLPPVIKSPIDPNNRDILITTVDNSPEAQKANKLANIGGLAIMGGTLLGIPTGVLMETAGKYFPSRHKILALGWAAICGASCLGGGIATLAGQIKLRKNHLNTFVVKNANLHSLGGGNTQQFQRLR